MTRVGTWVAVSFLLLPAGVLSLPDGGAEPSRHLESTERLELSGILQARGSQGALHQGGSSDLPSFELSAERLLVTMSFRRGVEAGHQNGDPLLRHRAEAGQSKETIEGGAMVELSAPDGPVDILAFGSRGGPQMDVQGTGASVSEKIHDAYVVRAGDSPDAEEQGMEEQVSFWYQPPRPWVSLSGADRGIVSGNFSLFVNNVTVSIHQDGEEVWRNWTGYREENPDQPVTRYEERILILEVTDGHLEVHGDDSVQLLGPSVDVETIGAVTSDAVDGRLTSQAGTFLFDREPMTLEGRGRLTLSAPAADGPEGRGLLLSVDPASAFEVDGGQRVAQGGDRTLGGLPIWGLLALAGVLLATPAAVRFVRRDRGPFTAWRDRRYTKWMTQGRELASGRDFQAATTCFRKATRARPEKGIAWYHLALATLETRDHEATLGVVDEIREEDAPVDPLDLLEVEVEASRRAGRAARCRTALETLADQAPMMARGLVADLEMDRDELGPELAGRLKDHGEPGGLPGYV